MILQGDCVEKMRELDEASIDAIVCDPPYGLEFMGKEWDRLDHGLPQENVWKGRRGKGGSNIGTDDSKPASRHHVALGVGKRHQFKRCVKCGKRQFSGSPCECEEPEWTIETPAGTPSSSIRAQRWHQAWATEALRVLKPGGHLLAFGGTRTYHRLACAIEDAGFEIRDSLIWLYGSGFPKSLDVSKAIDKRGGNAHLAEEIAAALKKAREDRGWTKGQADKHFCDGSTNWTWYEGRKGECRPPTTEDFARIALVWPELAHLAEKVAAVEGDIVGTRVTGAAMSGRPSGVDLGTGGTNFGSGQNEMDVTAPATPEAQKWNGWGTALKPGHEPIVVARKPLIGTVAQNVTEHGTGALNIDGCRIGLDGEHQPTGSGDRRGGDKYAQDEWTRTQMANGGNETPATGRWPANVLLSHLPECEQVGVRKVKGITGGGQKNADKYGGGYAPPGRDVIGHADPDGTETILAYNCAPGCPIAELDEQSGELHSQDPRTRQSRSKVLGVTEMGTGDSVEYSDRGGASRFFYCAKASRGERNAGLDGFEKKPDKKFDGGEFINGNGTPSSQLTVRNNHPTVKPIDLMRWLVRLVTPPGGTVLDPFAGSGTTGVAAVLEGFDFLGIEREAEYAEIARARIEWWSQFPGEDTDEVLIRAGFSERLEREHREAGQMGLL